MIIFLVALFIMLVAAITTELIRSKKHKSIMNYMMFVNALLFLGAVAFFFYSSNPIYMVVGMLISVGALVLTYYRHTDF